MEHMLNRHQLHLFLWVSKQWGYQTVHGTNPVTYDLPIPFEEAPFTVAISTGNSGNHASCGGFTKTTIVLRAGTTAGVWDTVGFFIIGCQLQWGTNRTNGIYSFPIPFTEALCCFGGGEAGSGYYDNASAYSNTQVRVYSDGSSRFVSWIAIGA